MKIYCSLILYLLFLPVISPAQWQQKDFDAFLQLKGTWQIEGQPEFEHWDSLNDTTLNGAGYALALHDTIVNERLTLQLSGGRIDYIATVTRQNEGLPVKFEYKKQEGNSYTFENKQHDFPQVITYTFQDSNTILIALKGQGKKQEQTIHFIMSRLKH